MVEHKQRQPAESNSEPKQKCPEVRPEELHRRYKQSHGRQDQCSNPGDQCKPAPSRKVDHFVFSDSSWLRLSGGASLIVAAWLSCSARMYAVIAQRSRNGI